MGFQELTGEQWAFIAPLLPPRAKTGRPQGPQGDPVCAGYRLPVVRYAPPIWRRSDRLAAVSGTSGKGSLAPDPASPSGLGVYAGEGEDGGGGGRFHAGGGEKRGEGVGVDGRKKRKGTKARVWVNEDGLPLRVAVGPGDEHDGRRLEEALEGLRVKKSGRGRARRRPKGVYADAAYDAKAIREGLRRRGIRAGIPKNPRRGKGTRGGKRAFRRRKAYRKARSSVERFFGWLKGGFRRLTVRHERRLSTFLAFVLLACFLIAWRILR